MEPIYQNQQDYLALQFHLMDIKLSKSSHEAVLAIRRLNFISKIPLADQRIRRETERALRESLLSYVPSSLVLIGEGYYFDPLKN
ncbi:MAG: hypothetical protein H7Y03_14350 [Chitinophagaceae bacterium]|nr:hypothetical protein [Chitinophagaceae bacterium]